MHTFGYGRRKCLGMDIADDELFVTGASLLWAFDMAQAVDSSNGGAPVPIDTFATNSHVILEPDAYQMRFAVRGEARRLQVLKNYVDVQEELKVY